jgi:hypothetical protein
LRRLLQLAAGLVLVAGGAVGCSDGDGGGGGKADDPPSTKEFCGALTEFKDDFDAADPTKDLEAYIKTLKDAADRLADVGTPEDMPDDAQDGFAITVKKIDDLSDSATVDDLAGIGEVSDADQQKLDALDAYIARACPGLDGEPDSSESPG